MKYLAALLLGALIAAMLLYHRQPDDEPLAPIFDDDWRGEDTYVAALARRLAA